ncbi:MAG: hypothetical protein OSB00_15100 [Sphingomonas bacterium]|nr:hypothetical protein [Sphingomonas bacterium]
MLVTKQKDDMAVIVVMTERDTLTGDNATGDVIVMPPRIADAIGQALKGAFATQSSPADMMALLSRMDEPIIH